jgi:hypothetical protein
MCGKPKAAEKVVPVRCQPKTYPCPTGGRRGRRKRRPDRFVRPLAYGHVLWLHVLYAEYTARCDGRKYFRSCPPRIGPKADDDDLVRAAVLNRILDDGLNAARTRAAMKRDFSLDLSSGFIYDCLDWALQRLSRASQRRLARQHFSGYLSLEELHLGDYTLLLATGPITDRTIGYRLVRINDQAHLRCFLRALPYWGFQPKVVVTDGSNLYPAALQEVWPGAKHQLCVSHVPQDVTDEVLGGVRRPRRQQARRGQAGRKRRRGRRREEQKRRQRRRGPRNKEEAAFVYKHRSLIVKRTEDLTKKDWADLVQMFRHLPELRTLWYSCQEVYRLFSAGQVIRLARRRRTLLRKKQSYQEVPELVQAMGLLEGEEFDKTVAFLGCSAGARVRTNNHVERASRKRRYDERACYKFRSERSLARFLRLRLDRLARQASSGRPLPANTASSPKADPSSAPNPGGD